MITVFTPTYNRVNDLQQLYNSLDSQTDKHFKWLIVDDGSQDGTSEYINEIRKESCFEIIYHFQHNSGKHVAINWALDHCTTQYMICVDSDDTLTENAISILMLSCANPEFEKCWAVVGPRYSEIKHFSNWRDTIPESLLFSQIYSKYKYEGETFMLWNLKWFQGIRFPVFEGERFIPESAIYEKLDQVSTVLVKKDKIYISDYHQDGLTLNSHISFIKNRRGYAYANYVSASNRNRSVLQRSMYYGRCLAILKRGKVKVGEINHNTIDKTTRLLGLFFAFGIFLIYTVKKQ